MGKSFQWPCKGLGRPGAMSARPYQWTAVLNALMVSSQASGSQTSCVAGPGKQRVASIGAGAALGRRSAGAFLLQVGLQPAELVGVEPAQHPWSEEPLQKPPTPPAPCQVVSIRRRQCSSSRSGATVKVVTALEFKSDSVSTRVLAPPPPTGSLWTGHLRS